MKEQVIISISREYGTGGHEIANKIAEAHSFPLYDRNILEEVSRQKNVDVDNLTPYDEKPKNVLMSRTVRGHSNSVEEHIAKMQFDFIREKAASGESFVIVGRCAETVLADCNALIPIFITGNMDKKIARIMRIYNLSEKDAIEKIRRHDKYRRKYHNSHSNTKWGDSRHYALCINSSPLGIDGTVKTIETMVKINLENRGK